MVGRSHVGWRSWPPVVSDPVRSAAGRGGGGGLGAELVDREAVREIGLEGVSLRISAITGDDLFGWSVAGGLEF